MDVPKAVKELRYAYSKVFADCKDPRTTIVCTTGRWNVSVSGDGSGSAALFDCTADTLEHAIAGVAGMLLYQLCSVQGIKENALLELGELAFRAVGGITGR